MAAVPEDVGVRDPESRFGSEGDSDSGGGKEVAEHWGRRWRYAGRRRIATS